MTHPDEAAKLAQRAAGLAPDNPTVRIRWDGYCRKNILALQCLRRRLQEPAPRREFHLAICYLKSGNKELGEKLLQKALAQDSTLPTKEQGW